MKKIQYILILLLAMCLSFSVTAQKTRLISGIILDEKSEPIIGANIIIPGTNNGTITGLDGKFSIPKVSTSIKTIQVSYVGYITTKIQLTDKAYLTVNLVPTNSELNEVVVVGYGSQKKAHLTGAISTLDPKEIENLNGTNLGSLLAGKIVGLSVSGGNGRPGEAARMTIRQAPVNSEFSTVSGFVPDNSPLYVIDDFISSESAFNNLDPTMIENVSVLKDAAAAIYGARSANGVILVTTKRGKDGAPKISYNGQFGYTDEVSRAKMLDAYNYGKIWNAVRFANSTDNIDQAENLKNMFQADELEKMKSLNYDLLEREWKAAVTQKHAINVSGGNDKTNYFAGMSYTTQAGNLGNIDYNRWNYRAGLDAKIGKSLKASLQVSGDYGDKNSSYSKIGGSNGGETDYNYLLTHPRYMPDYVNGLPIAAYGITNSGREQFQLYNYKTTQNLDNYSKSMSSNMTINTSLEYDFSWINALKGLKVRFSYSKNIGTSKTNQYASNYTLYSFNKRTGSGMHLYTEDEIDMSESNLNKITVTNGNSVRRSMSSGNSYQMNLTANYARSFGKHDVSALFTIEKAESESEDLNGEVLDPYPFTNGQSTSATGVQSTQFGRSESGILSYAGRMNYAYANKYLVEVLLRVDASTKFSPDNYWATFPSLSAGWVMSEEKWFQDKLSGIDFLKIRGSLGLLGRDNIKAWQWLQTYGLNSDKGPIIGITPTTIAGSHISLPDGAVNSEAHWDNSYKSNLGIDMNLLKNRMSLGLDGYYEWNRGVFMTRQGSSSFPATVGTAAAAENYGAIDNYGVEFSIGWKDKIGDFKYNIKINTGLSDNKILVKPWPALIPFDDVHPGQRDDVGSWGYECIGMFRSRQEIEEFFSKNQVVSYMGMTKDNVQPGMLIYNNIRGSQKADGTYYGPNDPNDPKAGYIDANDRILISNRSNPYGFTANLGGEWKGISFSAQISANWGGYSYVPKQARSISSLVSTAGGYETMQYTNLPSFWANNMFVYSDITDAQGNVVVAQNVDAKYPNLRYSVNDYESTFWRISGTRISINTLTLGYSIPKNIVKKATLESCKLNISVQNVMSLYNPFPDNFIDPMSGNYGTYPNLRRVTLGVNVSF